jgi:WD40 repeat protein/tRNA A-37 threonylcarbamoyl transferase component Bud32
MPTAPCSNCHSPITLGANDAARDRCPRCGATVTAAHTPDATGGYVPTPDATGGYLPTPDEAADVPTAEAAEAAPGYEVLSELGRGGMGVVYRARDTRLNREVALKMILNADPGRATVARFWAEAEIMAAVKHPNVVAVYELGESAGRPFMAMELLGGGSLDRRLKDDTLTPREAAALMQGVAAGVGAAHDQGVVHRDLKPGNVLLDADGTPKVTDFGLAKRRSHEMTQTNVVMGTPAYMAPEQAVGQAKFVGPPADVWALGVILYECVSGRRPFAGDTVPALLAQIGSAEPTPLRALSRRVSRDLDTIVARCLSKEPEHRYPTAGELAADLGRFLRGEPIAARPVGAAERVARWVRRKPTAAAAWGFSALAVALAAVVFVVFGFWRAAEKANTELAGEKKQTEAARDTAEGLRLRADEARREAEKQRGIAQQAQRDTERERAKLAVFEYGRTTQVAYQQWQEGNTWAVRQLLDGTKPELRGWEWHYLNRIADGSLLTLREEPEIFKSPGRAGGVDGKSIRSAVWSPDGTRILMLDYGFLHRSAPRVWDASTGKAVCALKGRQLAWSPDGTRVLAFNYHYDAKDKDGGPARVFDAGSGAEVLALRGHARAVQTAAWSPDGTRIVTAAFDSPRVCDAATGKEALTLQSDSNVGASAVLWSPDGARILAAGGVMIWMWDATTGKEVLAIKLPGIVTAAAWSPDGERILINSGMLESAMVHVWHATGKEIFALKRGRQSAQWSPDGNRIVLTDGDTARVCDATTGKEMLVLRGHTGGVLDAAFGPDGARIVTASTDRSARVWDATTGKEVLVLRGHAGEVLTARWSPDGTRILTASIDGSARVWDATVGADSLTFKGRTQFSPDGTRVLTVNGLKDGGVRVLDAETGDEKLAIKVPSTVAKWGPDGTRILTIGQFNDVVNGGVRVWDAKTGNEVLAIRAAPAPSAVNKQGITVPPGFGSAALSPDQSRILTTSLGGEVRVWDAKTGAKEIELQSPPGPTLSSWVVAVWSPDGTRVVTVADSANRVHLWDARTGKEVLTLTLPNPVHDITWSHDRTRLVTVHSDGMLRVWDPKTGKEVRALELKGYIDRLFTAVFSPDGSRVLTASTDAGGGVRVWDAATGAELLALKPPGGLATAAVWSSDGTRIIAACGDGMTHVYDSRPFTGTPRPAAPPLTAKSLPLAPPPRPSSASRPSLVPRRPAAYHGAKGRCVMVTLYVGGKAVSWADAEKLLANAGPADLIELRNAAGRVLAVCEPVEDPDWVKAITPEETARRMAEPGYSFDEMKKRLGWE